MDDFNAPVLVCHICGHFVALTTCTIDEDGNAVHEECYAKELQLRWDRSLIFPTTNENGPKGVLAFVNQFIPFALWSLTVDIIASVPGRFQCRAILFDMDGTLVDSSAVTERVWTKWAVRHRLNVKEILPSVHGRRSIDVMRQVAPHLNISEQEAAFLDTEEAEESDGVSPIPGASDVLSSLSHHRWAIVTSATRELAETRLRVAGLSIPSVLISADDVMQGKPNPEGYQLAAARLAVRNSECLVVEDTCAGLDAGMSAGMQVLSIGDTIQPNLPKQIPWVRDLTQLRVTGDHDLLTVEWV